MENEQQQPLALQYHHITVSDWDESLAFYRDALGLEVHNDIGDGAARWVTLGGTNQNGLQFVLSLPHAGRTEADGDALQELLSRGVLPMIVFSTDDLDTTFERVRATGAEGVAGADRPAVGARRLCVPRPVGQHGAHPAGRGSLTVRPATVPSRRN